MLDFPTSPNDGQIYAGYLYSGGVWMQSGALLTPTAQARNRIVNPAMQISQENGVAVGTGNGYYIADQWMSGFSSTGTYTAQRVQVATPNGSRDRLRLTVTVADAVVAATDFLQIRTNIEGVRLADFRYGSASSKQSILRFGFKAPAGTYSVELINSAGNRTYLVNFTITAGQANTDTEQTFIIPGDTTGTWLTDNGIGCSVCICMAAGTTYQGVAGWQAGGFIGTSANTNGMGTAGNVFELFDVGLYLDPQATGVAPPWQMPDEAQELAACMRYYEMATATIYGYQSTGTIMTWLAFKARKRVTPAASILNFSSSSNATAPAIYDLSGDGCGVGVNVSAAGPVSLRLAQIPVNARM